MDRQRFPGLQTKVYEHPFDRQALTSLERTPMLSLVLKKINEYGIDRLLRTRIIGSDLKVTPRNFPRLYDALVETCEILDLSPLPELYLNRGTGNIQTYAMGVEKPIIGLNLEAMEWLSGDELLFLLGYEVGRIKGKYLAYQQLPYVMPILKTLISSTTLGFGGLAANGLEIALYNWMIMARFTTDRAGLLVCQNVDAAITALMKLGGLPGEYISPEAIEDFVTQAREFSVSNLKGLDQITKTFSFMDYFSPWGVMRTSELLKWIDAGSYNALLQGNQPIPEAVEPLEASSEDDDEEWNFINSWGNQG